MPQPLHHCLLITHLDLTNLRQNTHGTYRRLRTLALAMQASGLSLRIVTTIPVGLTNATLGEIAGRIEEDLRELWSVQARVRVAPQAPSSNWLWLVQQLRAVAGYGQMPATRATVSPALLEILSKELEANPKFVVAHRLLSMFTLSRLSARHPAIYFDMDDLDHIVLLRSLCNTRNLREKILNALLLPALMYTEVRAVRRAKATFVCSSQDAHHLSAFFFSKSVRVLPNAVTIPAAPARASDGYRLLMVGAYAYGPNADGAEFFIHEIFPLVRKRIPEAELWLAGAGSDVLPSFAASPVNVRFLGFVEDIGATYGAARLVICPIRYGGGTRVKLIEAAAWGKPIVTTTLGAEGLGMRPDRDALFADRPEDFAEACIRLIEDDALCARLGANARQLAIDQFDQQRIVAGLTRLFLERPAKT